MTTTTWLAVAGALLSVASPSGVGGRVRALAGAGRLAALGSHRRAETRQVHWSRNALLATGVGAAACGVTLGPAAGIAVGAAGWSAARLARDLARRRAAADARRQLVAAVRLLVGELEIGTRPALALLAAAEAAPRYAATFHAAAVGTAGSGDAVAALCRDPDTRSLGLAWRLGTDTGAPLAAVLARVADDLAAEQGQRRVVSVALAGPRASAALLAGLPLLGVGLGALMGARPWAFLLGSAGGRVVGCCGVLLDLAGLMWMRAILHRAEQPC